MNPKKQNVLYLLQFLTLIGLAGFYAWQILDTFGVLSPLVWVLIPLALFMVLFILDFEIPVPISYTLLKPMKKTAEYFLAGCIFFLFSHISLLFINLFFNIPLSIISIASIVIFLSMFIYAYFHAQKIIIQPISFSSEKINQTYTFIQLSDVHLGSNGHTEIKKIVALLETLSFDFMVITGDLIDEDYARYEDIQLLATIQKPIYYITGNHEYNLHSTHFRDFIEHTNIIDLNNKKVSINEIDIYGIDEISPVPDVLNNLQVDTNRCAVCLIHEPYYEKFNQAATHGIDFIFSGHTHNGQFFPLTILAKYMYRYIHGFYTIGTMQAYVSQGTGTWGPQIRLGTSNEITHVTLVPAAHQ